MGEKKVTIMRLKVDLQCCKCRKKVKKILWSEIQDQIYNEKENTVTIKVVCCSPEKIMEKIRCKGDESIKSIEIVPPTKPVLPEAPGVPVEPKKNDKNKDRDKDSDKTKDTDKETKDIPKAKPANPPQPPPPQAQPEEPKKPKEKPADPPQPAPPQAKPQEPKKPKEKPADPPQPQPKPPEPVPQPPPPVVVPCIPATGYPPPYPCCRECYEGRGGGPCYGGPQRVRYYDGYCGRPVYDSWGGGYGRSYYKSRCTDYISEENPNAACTIV